MSRLTPFGVLLIFSVGCAAGGVDRVSDAGELMRAELAALLALIISAFNSVVGFCVFLIHCRWDKRRDARNVKKSD